MKRTINLSTHPGFSYRLSGGKAGKLDITFDMPLNTAYQKGEFLSVKVDGELLFEGCVQSVSEYGFVLVSYMAILK